MNLAKFIAAAIFNHARSRSDTLKMSTVQEWIKQNGNTDNHGSGYVGNRLPSGRSNAFVELRRNSVGGGIDVIANVYLDAKQGAASSITWHVKRLDAKLEKLFGHNLRVRINV